MAVKFILVFEHDDMIFSLTKNETWVPWHRGENDEWFMQWDSAEDAEKASKSRWKFMFLDIIPIQGTCNIE